MNWWPFGRRVAEPSEEAVHAHEQGKRARLDAERLDQHVAEVARQSHEIRLRNHFGEALTSAFARKGA